MIVKLIEQVYGFLWGDLLQIPLPGGGSVGISLLIILLIPAGIYFTIRTRVLPIRLFPDMVTVLTGKKEDKNSLSTFQTLIVSTATRVGMGNLVGVVAAVSKGLMVTENSLLPVYGKGDIILLEERMPRIGDITVSIHMKTSILYIRKVFQTEDRYELHPVNGRGKIVYIEKKDRSDWHEMGRVIASIHTDEYKRE